MGTENGMFNLKMGILGRGTLLIAQGREYVHYSPGEISNFSP